MKQAKIDNILYVFDREPYVITKDTDADIIYVQQECIQGFQELNPSLTLSVYNYSTFQITKPVWYDAYMQEDEEGYTPEAVEPDETNWNIQMFSNGDRGVGLRLTSDNPTVDADRTDLQAAFESIGASSDDYIDDLVGEYDSDLAITPQVSTRGKKNAKSVGDEEEMTKIEVHKGGFGKYSFHSDNQVIMSVDYSDTSSDECVIDATGLSTGENEVITFSLINKQAITKQEAGIYFSNQSQSIDIYDGTTSVDVSYVENPNDLVIEYSVDDPDLTLTDTGNAIEVSGLKVGSFTIIATTDGNDYYLAGSATMTLVVTSEEPVDTRVSPNLQFDQPSYSFDLYTDGLTGTIEISNPYDVQNVSITSDMPLSMNIVEGPQVISVDITLAQGTFTITASFAGDQNYLPQTIYTTMTVSDSTPATQPIDYPVTLLNNNIQFDPDVSDQDVEDAITGNLDGYDSSWMPEPTITVTYGSGDSDIICSDVLMSNLDFSGDMSNITFGSTVWTVYYHIATTTYVDEDYNEWYGNFTISFVDYAPTYEDYPVTLLDSTTEVEYEEGSSEVNYVNAVADALMGLLNGYDDTWMPTPTCLIYAPDPEDPNTEVPITEDTEIGGSTFINDLSAAFQESGAVVADQTQWHVTMTIPSSTYAGDDYQAWGSGDIYLSFVSPAVEPLGHLRLTSNQNGSTVGFTHGNDASSVSLEYTTDEGANWQSWDFSSITLDEGESVCFRGVNNSFGQSNLNNTSNVYRNYFNMTGDLSASGNIMSLLYGDNFEGQTSTKATGSFAWLFASCSSLNDVSQLELPAIVLHDADYIGMFSSCSNIRKAPYLPADIYTEKCYMYLFAMCSNLSYIKFNLSSIGSDCTLSWLNSVITTGMLINENPNFDSSTLLSGASGLPSGWTFLTSDPIDYPVNITDEHTYQHGETHQASDIENLIMSCISGYDDTWMPAIQCTITDTPGGAPLVTYTDHTDLGGTQWTSDVSDALIESGAITSDETIWTCELDIPAYTYNGQYYNAWSGVVQISFYSV